MADAAALSTVHRLFDWDVAELLALVPDVGHLDAPREIAE